MARRKQYLIILLLSVAALATIGNTIYLPLINQPQPTPTTTATIAFTPTATLQPTATTAPSGVTISNDYIYQDTIDYLHLLGEITNHTGQVLNLIRIDANLYYPPGIIIDTSGSYARMDDLPPGDRSCFEIYFDAPPTYSNYSFEPATYYTGGTPLTGLTIVSHFGSYDSIGYYEIIGEIRNDNTFTVEFVQPIATVYDSSGKVIGCDSTVVNSTDLAPGQTSAFKIYSVNDELPTVHHYRLQVDGYIP